MSDLQDVPVKDIVVFKKAFSLDLSNNHLKSLPNKLQYLPLSFSKLKALKWLDLKDNPLVPAVAKVSGLCLDAKQCQTCAKDVVSFFTQVQEQIASDIENRQKQRQKQLEANQQKQMENKKNKKKEKSKQKKENGPLKENVSKPPNKKNKKPATEEKQPEKPSSLFKLSEI
ncbi:LRR 8 domain containing protein [Asbolus verrucosus]|uniref:LRR 8 domain containing protein n=1 Tax=Asbolus verrucosus TaxID=1661398 RepID=A0A482VVS4_ASBVE|nr:LRR 8 domain containing protein [Asbolus verrucosus]